MKQNTFAVTSMECAMEKQVIKCCWRFLFACLFVTVFITK